VQQRDVGRPVGVVLDRGDLRRDVVARALEVDPPVQALGAAAAVALRPPDFLSPSTRDFSGVVFVISA
jgi:hypothetical protein